MNESNDTLSEVASLQKQVFALLLALVVLSGTLVVYFYYQSHTMDKDLAVLRVQAKPVADWVAQNQAGVEKFKADLVTYSKTHPEFLPVLQKYGYVAPAPAPKPGNTALPPKK